MSESQAVTSVVREAQTTTTDGLATRADLREQELRLEAKLADLKTGMADLKAELMKWMIGALGLQNAGHSDRTGRPDQTDEPLNPEW